MTKTSESLGCLTYTVSVSRIESFIFDKQKRKFPYINAIGDIVDDRIPKFKEIWPLLGAYTCCEHWDGNIDENLEIIGTAHYTILKSLSYIFQNKNQVGMNDDAQRYKNIIFHYALILDCIKQISFYILKFKNKLKPDLNYPIKKLSEEEFREKMNNLSYKEYEKQFEIYKDYGGLIMNIVQPEHEFISILAPNKKLTLSFNIFKNIIDPLRNLYIHNPAIDIFYKKGEGYQTVKKEIKKHRTLQSINNLEPENIGDPVAFMEELFNKATKMLSDVWSIFYDEIEKINTHPNFPNKMYR